MRAEGTGKPASRNAPLHPALRPAHTVLFTAVVLVLALTPWMVDNWPTQDGPSHLAAAHIFTRYHDPDAPFARYLTLDGGALRPSTLYYGALSVLGKSCGLRIAEKLLGSLTIAALPLSTLLFVWRLAPERTGASFLVLPLATGWALAMGFVPFLMALSCGYCALGLGWAAPGAKKEGRDSFVPTAGASVAFLVCALLHPVVSACTGVALVLLYGPRLWREGAWIRVALVTAPAVVWVGAAYLAADSTAPAAARQTQWAPLIALLPGIVEYHVAYSAWELAPRGAALLLLLLLAVRTVRFEGLRGVSATGAVARVVAVFFVLYMCAPKVLSDWYYCSARFLIFATFLLPALVEIPPPHRDRIPALGAALAVGVFACDLPPLSRLSREVQDVLDVGSDLPTASKVIPMNFADRQWGSVDKPQPLAHAWALLVIDHDALGSQLPAAGKPRMGGERFRMLSFRPTALDTATGALPWSSPEGAYEVTRACGDSRLRGDCSVAIAERKSNLNAVRDRYDYVLMLSPPPLVRDALGERLTLRKQVGEAWLYGTRTHG